MKSKLTSVAFGAALCCFGTTAFAESHSSESLTSPTLAAIVERGYVKCGVTEGVPGFSARNAENQWAGLEVDYCRALGAAIFDDADSVQFTALNAIERFSALSSGEIDVLSRTSSWTLTHETDEEISFVGAIFYDGQGFMVRAEEGLNSALDLGGKTVCIESGTTSELNAVDFFATNELDFEAKVFLGQDEVVAAYQNGECQAYSSDSSALAAVRTQLPDPAAHVVLPEIISKEPLGPSVRTGDSTWFNIARWAYFSLLEAEELGVSSTNVEDMLGSENPAIKRLLGVEGDYGIAMELTPDWAYRIVKHVGNYGEVFDRHVGPSTLIGLERGLNDLWTRGGLHYSPPVR